MRHGTWLLCLAAACAAPIDDAPDAPPATPPRSIETPAPGKTDGPWEPPPHAIGIACDHPNARSCEGDAPLRCVAGSGGAIWMAADACDPMMPCVPDHGCMPLPACTDAPLQSCVGQNLFRCDLLDGGGRQWHHIETCPDGIPCVDGRGCPNPFGVGDPCRFVDPPRCVADGRVMECVLEGIDARWSPPLDCPDGETCVPGSGCEPEEREPADGPDKQQSWP